MAEFLVLLKKQNLHDWAFKIIVFLCITFVILSPPLCLLLYFNVHEVVFFNKMIIYL